MLTPCVCGRTHRIGVSPPKREAPRTLQPADELYFAASSRIASARCTRPSASALVVSFSVVRATA